MRKRPSRAFRPSMTDAAVAPALERRDNPGPLWLNLWDFPQSDITLTDRDGTNYPVNTPQDLLNGLETIRDNGGEIDELFIKGHGAEDLIYLNDDGSTTLALIQDHLLIGGQDVTELFQDVSGQFTHITLTGCDTGDLAEGMSGVVPNIQVTGQTLPYALGIPWTGTAIGWHETYQNGTVYVPDLSNQFDNPPAPQ